VNFSSFSIALMLLGLGATACGAQSPAASAACAAPASVAPAAAAAAPVVTGDKAYSPAGDFTVTLPAGWVVGTNPDRDLQVSKGRISIAIQHEDANVDATKWADITAKISKEAMALDEKERKEVTLGALQGLQLSLGSEGFTLLMAILPGTRTYNLTTGGTTAEFEAARKDVEAIMQSFKVGR
jgi:hypothetical protein